MESSVVEGQAGRAVPERENPRGIEPGPPAPLPPGEDVSTSMISRYVAFFWLPAAAAIATLVTVKAQAWFGIKIDSEEATALIGSIGLGIIVWLINRGRWELQQQRLQVGVGGADPNVQALLGALKRLEQIANPPATVRPGDKGSPRVDAPGDPDDPEPTA